MRYYLVGYMYAGKSTYGRKLARTLNYDFVDTDRAFEQKYKLTIPMFFAKYGEELFRKLESQLLREVSTADNVVIATGGGTPCYGDNMDFILANGRVIYLETTLEAILSRLAVSKNPRPLLTGKPEAEQRAIVEQQLAERQPIYARAHITLDALSPDISAFLQPC